MKKTRWAPLSLILVVVLGGCGESVQSRGARTGSATPAALQEPTTLPQPTPTAWASDRFYTGWYTSATSSEYLGDYQQAGMNLMVTSSVGKRRTHRWLRNALGHGMRVLLEPDSAWIRQANRSQLAAFIRRYRHNPALFGWHLYDEPDFTGLPPEKLVAAYQRVKQLDPRHPVAVDFATGQCRFGPGAIDPRYLPGFDLFIFDRYPFYTNLPGVDPLQDIAAIATTCMRTARTYHKLGPILVLQGFGNGTRDGPFVWRDPKYQETLCSVRLVAHAGALGVLFWTDQHADAAVRRNTDTVVHQWRLDHGDVQKPPNTKPC